MCRTHARRKYEQRLEQGLVTGRASSKRRPVRDGDESTTSDEEAPAKRQPKRRAVTAATPAVVGDPAPPAVVAVPAPPPATDAAAPAQAAFQVLIDASTSQAAQTPTGEETSQVPAEPAIPRIGPPTAQDLGLTGTVDVFGWTPPEAFSSCGWKTPAPSASSSSPAPPPAKAPRTTRGRP